MIRTTTDLHGRLIILESCRTSLRAFMALGLLLLIGAGYGIMLGIALTWGA